MRYCIVPQESIMLASVHGGRAQIQSLFSVINMIIMFLIEHTGVQGTDIVCTANIMFDRCH